MSGQDYGGAFNPNARALCVECGWRGGHDVKCSEIQKPQPPTDPKWFDKLVKQADAHDAQLKEKAAADKTSKVPTEICVGQTVLISGLESQPELNGTHAVVKTLAGARWVVELLSSSTSTAPKQLSLTPERLLPLSDDAALALAIRSDMTKGVCMIRELGPGSGAVDVSNDGDETVMKVVVKEGNGTTKPTTRSHVVVDYVGTLVSGKQFDSSRSRNVKFDFHIDVSPVIAGTCANRCGCKVTTTCTAAA